MPHGPSSASGRPMGRRGCAQRQGDTEKADAIPSGPELDITGANRRGRGET